MADFYTILRLPRDATQDEIQAAFRRLAHLHPDRHPGNTEAADKFKEISVAYATLSDPKTRAEYDTILSGPAGFDLAGAANFGLEVCGLVASLKAPLETPAAFAQRMVTNVVADGFQKAAAPEGRQAIRDLVTRAFRPIT